MEGKDNISLVTRCETKQNKKTNKHEACFNVILK
jgi:hypothetical protein